MLNLFKVPLHESKDTIELGTKEHVLSLPCKAHNRLLSEVVRNDEYPDLSQSPIDQLSVFKFEGEPSIGISGTVGYLAPDQEVLVVSDELDLLQSNSASGLKPTAHTVHPSWIRNSLPRRWKDHCQCHHGTECNEPPLVTDLFPNRPEWLVDVWRLCLVRGTTSNDYVALSYVWGEKSFFTATKDNIDHLQSPGTLSKLQIPTTIRDAFGFTEMLGERYLWVDSLCIVQDDPEAKYAEMSKMSAIFAKASVTIIAANGSNAHCGLPGLRGTSVPRAYKQEIFHLGKGSRILLEQRSRSEASLWNTRAWTFQEKVFSRRKVIFENNFIRWECPRASWREDTAVLWDGRHTQTVAPRLWESMITAKLPDPPKLGRLLQKYNTRNHTYPEDALNAFAGVMSAFLPTFKGGFLSGLPLAIFPNALLWQPDGNAIRRVARRNDHGRVCLPSWSWAGWQCELATENWNSAADYIHRHPSIKYPFWHSEVVVPLVQWYTLHSLDAEGTPIGAEWYEYRQRYWSTDDPPPAGWTKHAIQESSHNFKTALDLTSIRPKCFYKPEVDPQAECWYPIPLPRTAEHTTPNISAPFLSGRTWRTWLLAGKRDSVMAWHGDMTARMWLNDTRGRRVGKLTLLEGPQSKEVITPECGYFGQPLELVRLSKGHTMDGNSHDISGLPYPQETLLFEFYHVMFIKWEDGIAYRKGLGRVMKEAWEAQEREPITLILG